MTQKTALELPEDLVGESFLEGRSPFPAASPNYKLDWLLARNSASSVAVDNMAAVLFGARPRIRRSETRTNLVAPLWLTSLRKPGIFEIVPTENVSSSGIQMIAQRFWEPSELVLVSSPPGFFVQGSIVYCKKLPSDDHILGIRLDTAVENWMETRRNDWTEQKKGGHTGRPI